MAEISVDTCETDDKDNVKDFIEVTVLLTGRTFEYRVPSFPVYKATLREIKLQWEDVETDTIHVFDAFAKECGLLDEHTTPAVTKIMFSYDNAFIIEVLITILLSAQ